MNQSLRALALAASCMLLAGQLLAEPKRPECIAPASPGGGFDLTCKLAQSALVNEKLLSKPMRVTYMPGGVGRGGLQRGRGAAPGRRWHAGGLVQRFIAQPGAGQIRSFR
jgi:tripartite-type tricarboxylate transporter receptor subunit TctC